MDGCLTAARSRPPSTSIEGAMQARRITQNSVNALGMPSMGTLVRLIDNAASCVRASTKRKLSRRQPQRKANVPV